MEKFSINQSAATTNLNGKIVYRIQKSHIPPFFATSAGSLFESLIKSVLVAHNTTRSDSMAGYGLLTGWHDRNITSPLSWCRVSAGNRHGAALPKNPATISGRTCRIHWNFWGVSMRGPTDGNTFFKELLASILPVTLWGRLMLFFSWLAR
jgi:hypothetical protein